jgi:hypothetical protein
MYDIIDFLQTYDIPYILSGKNVKEGNVNIKCPFCGSSDKSEHMGIELVSGKYGCWRNSSHRGLDFRRIVVELLGCSYSDAYSILDHKDVVVDENFEEFINSFNQLSEDNSSSKIIDVELLPTFYKIDNTGFRKRFFNYFRKRGFSGSDKKLLKFIDRFNIQCCVENKWTDRLIFPIYINNKLMTWQSRSIRKDTLLPYKDLSVHESVLHVKQCIYNFDELKKGGKTLYITEGVFDCIKLLYFLPKEYSATCIFTKTIQVNQINLLTQISSGFDKVVLLLDNDAWDSIVTVSEQLSCIGNLTVEYLQEELKDPGEMTEHQILKLIGE